LLNLWVYLKLYNIKSDPLQMEQIIMNLATNANDAMENGGVLTIETKNVYLDEEYEKSHPAARIGDYVHLIVRDTGAGIDENILEKIFEPFFTTKEMGRGTGLGLATVYGIVKQSGGNIWVESKPNQGTVFNIYLPKSEEPAAADAVEGRKRGKSAGNETVLIVEDQDDILELILLTLADTGYNVIGAGSGEEALGKMKSHKGQIDMVLTDVVLPDMNGTELSDEILKVYPAAEVVYMSGYADDAIARLGVLDVDKHFIQKPFSPFKLLEKIQSILEK
jgi:CheY-like chemotaxis protein